MAVHVAQSHLVGRFDPVRLFPAGPIGVLVVPVEGLEVFRHVLAGLKVDALPGADAAVDVLQALGEKSAHGDTVSFRLGFSAAVDAADSDALNLLVLLLLLFVGDLFLARTADASLGCRCRCCCSSSIRVDVRFGAGDAVRTTRAFQDKDLQEFFANEAMEAVEMLFVVWCRKTHATFENRECGIVDESPGDAPEGGRRGRCSCTSITSTGIISTRSTPGRVVGVCGCRARTTRTIITRGHGKRRVGRR
mmetsp:Transcript_23874/g.50317  ORF Transcript_23874/g.50317 Transcript_23874/m.50317 type:complete len:249 (-) Transcript_23874:1003-1749(-)